jgi:hypothetical protein
VRNPPGPNKQQQPSLAKAGQKPRVEGSDSPASGNGTPQNADGVSSAPKVPLRCNFHPGRVMYKVGPFLISEQVKHEDTDVVLLPVVDMLR